MTTQQQIAQNLQTLGFINPSNTAIFEKVAQAIGVIIDNNLTEFNNSQNSILTLISQKNYGHAGYYTASALAFQYGYSLSINPTTGDFYYATIDPSAQIVNQAAFEALVNGNDSQLFLKIATLNTLTNQLQPLSPTQLAAFESYYTNYELPGLPITIVNSPGNVLGFASVCTYYASYDLGTLQANIAAALLAFQTSFTFNGEFFAGDLQDYIKQNVPGVRDFFISNTTLDGAPFSGSIALPSGYFNYASNYLTAITYNVING